MLPDERSTMGSKVSALEDSLSEGHLENSNLEGQLRELLLSQISYDSPPLDIEEAIRLLSEDIDGQHALETIYLLRSLPSLQTVVSKLYAGGANRAIVMAVEQFLPGLSREIGLTDKRQNFERFEAVRTVHGRVVDILSPFTAIESNLESILASRKMLSQALGHNLVRSYCTPVQYAEVREGVEKLCNKLTKLSDRPGTLAADIQSCAETIRQELEFCIKNDNFLTRGYYKPFLNNCEQALERFLVSLRGDFQAPIGSRLPSGDLLQKRQPLKEPGRRINIAIPLRNGGPGTALRVLVSLEVDIEKILLAADELHLGNVAAGDFSAVFEAEVMSPSEQVEFLVAVSWDEAGGTERRQIEFIASVVAQRCDVPWAALEYTRPYSTDVAKGDTFVGRSDKVQVLANKMLRTPMESFYVTGQKRVGKTSLALAAAEFAQAHAPNPGICYKYLIWGRIANADPKESLRALGYQIASFFASTFPADTTMPPLHFEGSLAALITFAELAQEIRPGLKYVIILDEFDEIHPELYQFGNLAETLFANIRALTTLDNVCTVLVGGENMPYVMDRQGQKLNKFVRVPLDYFSRDREWEDFRLLVKRPTEDALEWHEEAISEIFNVTNGNPYFAKIVCGAVFHDCVGERDSDVTVQEVQAAIAAEVPTFDANSFVHLWQDGIHKPAAEREPDVLRRCRALVLVARAARRGLPIKVSNLLPQRDGILITDGEIVAALNDFARRGVFRENQGTYEFGLPIFRMWLIAVGGNRLIADALGEELALEVQSAEDRAFVRSDEVAELARRWPTYQGRSVTSDDIRAWYEQVGGHQQQRLLFKLLEKTRFFGETEIRERLEALHGYVRPHLPEFVSRRRSDRRSDVLITYLDGEGKSGQFYASRYAEANRLSAKSIIPPGSFTEGVEERIARDVQPSVIVILDDLVATGKSMARNLSSFITRNRIVLRQLSIPIIILVLAATPDGDQLVRSSLEETSWLDLDFRAAESLGPSDFAFSEEGLIWEDADERERARALCMDLGALIYPNNPLGYGEQGLLVVFPGNCPNNSLPILHSPATSSASQKWRPLFPRAVH